MSLNTTPTAHSSSKLNSTTSPLHEEPPPSEQPTNVIQEVLPIAIAIVLVNSMVFFLFAKRKRLRTPANCLLLSLAVCDFLTGLVSIPLLIVVVVHVVEFPASLHLGFFNVIFNNAMAISAAYHILVITLERFFAITRPFQHRQMTNKSSLKIAGLVWFIALLISFMPYAWFSRLIDDPISFQKIQFGYVVFCLVFVFLIPCMLIVYAQAVTFKAIATRGGNAMNSKKALRRRARNEKKCLIIFAVMAIIYVVCWLPWFVLTLYFSFWFPLSAKTNMILEDLAQAFVIFRYITSIVNPLLYTFFKRDFLEAFKLLFLKRKLSVSSQTRQSVLTHEGSTRLPSPKKKLIREESNEALEETQCITVL